VPTICNNVILGYGYDIHFTFEGRTVESGNVVTTGVGAQVFNIIQAPDVGHRLQIRSVDQADREIPSFTRLYYGGNETKAQGFSIVKTYTGTYYQDILLAGWYRILSIEPTIQDQWDEVFYLDADTSKNLIFELLAFTKMELRIPRISTNSGNITYTLSNNYPSLSNVYIHFYLQTQSGALVYNSTSIRPKLDKGIYQDTLIIDTKWYSDTYLFVGEVWVNGRLFIHQNQTQELFFPDNPFAFGESASQDIFLYQMLIVGLGIFSILGIGIAYFKDEIKVTIQKYQRERLEKKVKSKNAETKS
ncbi:MAG: hypothetical protein ACXAC2_01825, partial [Candidatus Kariarchaeaceae archaeon]